MRRQVTDTTFPGKMRHAPEAVGREVDLYCDLPRQALGRSAEHLRQNGPFKALDVHLEETDAGRAATRGPRDRPGRRRRGCRKRHRRRRAPVPQLVTALASDAVRVERDAVRLRLVRRIIVLERAVERGDVALGRAGEHLLLEAELVVAPEAEDDVLGGQLVEPPLARALVVVAAFSSRDKLRDVHEVAAGRCGVHRTQGVEHAMVGPTGHRCYRDHNTRLALEAR